MPSKKIEKTKPKTWWYLRGKNALPQETKEVHFETDFALVRSGRTMLRLRRNEVFSSFTEAARSMVPRKVWLVVNGYEVVAATRVRKEQPERLDGKNLWRIDEEVVFSTEVAARRHVVAELTKDLMKEKERLRKAWKELAKAKAELKKAGTRRKR